MIRRSTVVYIVILLALIGTYFFLKKNPPTADTEATPTVEPSPEATYLFPAEEGTPSSIRIEAKSGEIVEVARGADQAWALTQPVEAKADQGAAEAAATQATTMRVMDSVPDVDPKIIGLDVPEYVLTIKFSSGVERTVGIGVVTPTESGYYVRNADGKVVIVSKDAIDALLGLLKTPPYLETPTPSPIPSTETTTPLPEAATPTSEKVTPQP